MAEISVGIDLGTTNSCISTSWPNGQPRLLRDDSGVGVIPSVVSFGDDGRIEVGHKAKMRLLTDPQNTFCSTKRFIGRDMRLDENRGACSMYPYTLEAGHIGVATAVTRGARYPVFQISGYVLRHLKEMAEKSLERPVKRAVITVPANFNEVQRSATHQAGEFAGLEVLRIFNEPTAAALAYGLGKDTEQLVAVYDFGGGTFDITILRLEGAVFEVVATCGDMLLGGDDFDRRVLEDMLEQFTKEYGFNPEGDLSLRQRLMLGAERMKCQLTDWIVTAFEDRHVRRSDGQSLPPFHYELNRDRFRTLTGRFVDRSFEVCDEAFKLAGMRPQEVEEVILVGGTTRIPYLRDRVKQYFGRPPLDKIQPDVVVSIGASIQAYSLTGGEFIYPATARDMLPIRKVAARPPVPKPTKPGEVEFLDDFTDQLRGDEEAALKTFKKAGRTMQGMPRPRTPPPTPSPVVAPVPGARSRDDLLPAVAAGTAMVLSANTGAKRSIAELDEPDLSQPTLVAAGSPPFAPPPVARPRASSAPAPLSPSPAIPSVAMEVEPKAPSVPAPAAAGSQGQFTHTIRQQMPGAPRASTGADTLTFASRPPAFAAANLASTVEPLPPRQDPAPAPAARPASTVEDLLEEESMAHEASDPFASPSDTSSPEPQFSLDMPETAPVVTPESAARPFVPRDVIEEMGRVREQDALLAASGGLEAGPQIQPSRAPLLLDVTANTLGVATVGGFVEVLVSKNSPVPIEKRHVFTTSADDQERAVIRVLEGESSKASENHVLGEVELAEIRKAPRGTIKIEVCYEITVDGILQVSARNLETGEAQIARLTLFGG